MSVSRLSIACVLWSALLGCASAHADPIQPTSADAFIDSIGLNNVGGPYVGPFPWSYSGERKKLHGITPIDARYIMGVRHSRFEIRSDIDVQTVSNLYREQGVQIDALISWLWTDPHGNQAPDVANALQFLKKFPRGSVATIEGNNEADMPQESGDYPRYASSMRQAVENQEALYKAAKKDAWFADTPVIAFTLGKNWPWGGNVGYGSFTTAAFDYESLHSYTGGDTIEGSLTAPGHNQWLKVAHSILPAGVKDKPIIVTETGFTHRVVDKNKVAHNSELAQAKQEMMLLAQNYERGFVRTFLYSVGGEENWAMDTRDDGTPLPAGRALAFITSTLGEAHWDRVAQKWVKPNVTLHPAGVMLSKHPASVHTLLLQKADGSYYLLAWNDVIVWDNKTNADVHNPPTPLDATISGSIRQAVAMTMQDDGSYTSRTLPVEAATGGSKVNLLVPDSLMLVHLTMAP